MSETDRDNAAVDKRGGPHLPPPVLFLAGFLVGLAVQFARPLPAFSFWPSLVVGSVAVILGSVLALPGVGHFRRARTTLDPNGTPTSLIVTGPYRWTRNPIYSGLTLLYIGAAVWSGATWALVTLIPVVVVIDRRVIAREEQRLAETFGPDYSRYCSRTRRWL